MRKWLIGETRRKKYLIRGKKRLCEVKKTHRGIYSIHIISGRKRIKLPDIYDKDLVNEALEFQSQLNPSSVENDNNRYNQNTLPLTRPNLEKWMSNPSKYDLLGIDTLKKLVVKFNGVYRGVLLKDTYSKSDVRRARLYLLKNRHLYKNNRKYVELQAEIAKAISQDIDPATIDWISFMSGDKKLSETLRDERRY